MSDARSAWADPGAQDLGGGVHRISLPLPNDGLRAVNVYTIETPSGLVLIDGGWALAESQELLASSLDSIGHGLADIRRFLVTHMHRDHYTQAVTIRRLVGSQISLGAGEQAGLESTIKWAREGVRSDDSSHLLRAGAGSLVDEIDAARDHLEPGYADVWELPDSWLADGTDLTVGNRTLRVIATPGHTSGHVVYHDAAAGLLFAGDHVLPQITPSIGLEPVRPPLPLRDYLDSLRLMFTMPDARLLPAHGPVTASVHERVTELLAHHEDRLDASEAVVLAGAATAFEAANALTWTRHKRAFTDMDLFNKMLATSETAAHLDVLVLQGRLASSTDADGVEIYTAA